MKHSIFPFILAGVGLMSALNVTAKDVYVYTPAGENLVQATEIKRIEFDKNGKMILVPESGDKVNVDLSRLGYFAFKPVGSSGVSSVECTEVTVRLLGDILSVTSASEITEIRIYNVLGEMTGHCAPAACAATMTVNARGLNIVVVETGGITQTYKIVR